MSKNNLNFAGFAKGNKRNIPSDLKDDIIVFDRSGKQISLSDTDFIPKSLKELNNDGFISDWALTPKKPTYNFSEITDKPNTIAGYEIEDAVDLFSEQTISGAKTFTQPIKVDKIMIGDCAITWDSVNKCVKFSTGVASDSFVSARGVDK